MASNPPPPRGRSAPGPRNSVAPSRSKAPASKRISRPPSEDEDADSGRVRVAVRLRPKNAEDLSVDSDFSSCVELQPEMKRLRLRKNNWISECYRFDEVFTEAASQKRVYETVAKPVVESVLDGYNGTVMAYGQTGTGKTYTVGRLGKDDASERGIMARAMEDIFSDISSDQDQVSVSYFQLYLESIQDLLAPEKSNIPIVEDAKTGEISFPGAEVVDIKNLDQFLELLHIGESNRHAANTNLNTESSRSHAILVVHVKRSSRGKDENFDSSMLNSADSTLLSRHVPLVLRSKLLIVDLAGSERIDKSGSEGHMLEEAKFINLSLTSLGKCINALAENCSHIPTRDSKLTRLLRDSFGGTARTSLIITIGPSFRHYSETSSTIMFGQRAMKVTNTIKLKEELDYESLCRKLEYQVDYLTTEAERNQKLRDDDKEQMEKKLITFAVSLAEAEKAVVVQSEFLKKEKLLLDLEVRKLTEELNIQKNKNSLMSEEILDLEMRLKENKKQQVEDSAYQNLLADTTQMYEKRMAELLKQLEAKHSLCASLEEELDTTRQILGNNKNSHQFLKKEKLLLDLEVRKLTEELNIQKNKNSLMSEEILDLEMRLKENKAHQKEINELNLNLQELERLKDEALGEVRSLKEVNIKNLSSNDLLREELNTTREELSVEKQKRKYFEDEFIKLKENIPVNMVELEDKKISEPDSLNKEAPTFGEPISLENKTKSREIVTGQKILVPKIFEEVGLSNILALLRSQDLDVQIHAAKVVANLAAEDMHQERIVKEGGLDALLLLLETSKDTTIHRVSAGAIANLAMSGVNQSLIMSKGGVHLLANVAFRTKDPQTLRMVAGALANLCGNEKLHTLLKDDGGTKALLQMVKSGHSDVIAQVARGLANFAKCESRGNSKGRSLLIEDGALSWIVGNTTTYSSSTRRHIELALCHLAQQVDNTYDIILSGGMKELVRISQESSREDIQKLAKKTLSSNPAFLAQLKRM